MAVQQEFEGSVKGINSQYSQTSGMPEGGLLEANNCVADRPGIISKRRGFNRYGDQFNASLSALLEYQGSLIALDGGILKYDSDGEGTWKAWGSGFEHPDALHRIKSAEKSGNLYFNTNNGVYKTDALETTPVLGGMPEGLDLELSSSGSDGWFTADKAVGYRMIWSRKDANDNLLLGSPAYKTVITNPAHEVTISNPDGDTAKILDVDHNFVTGDIATIESEVDGYDKTSSEITVLDTDSYIYKLASKPSERLYGSS